MTNYFHLENSYNKLFAEIGETIKQYYPIGVSNDSPEYNEYSGIKKITALWDENSIYNKRFNKPWKDFLKRLRSGSNRKIYDTSRLSDVSFGAELILESYRDEVLFREKKIIFSVSFIAPFFSICGADETGIIEQGDEFGRAYRAINVITESPYKEFETDFKYLQSEIETKFTDYKFVPIRASLLDVKDLFTPTFGLSKVHNALFNDSFDFTPVTFFRGEVLYGSGPSSIKVELRPPPPSV